MIFLISFLLPYPIFDNTLSNLSFFVIDNPVYHTYTQNYSGFINCYIAAIPFFKTSIVADLVYSGVLFGAYYLIQQTASRKVVA